MSTKHFFDDADKLVRDSLESLTYINPSLQYLASEKCKAPQAYHPKPTTPSLPPQIYHPSLPPYTYHPKPTTLTGPNNY